MVKLALLLVTIVAGVGCAYRRQPVQYREARVVTTHSGWVRLGQQSVDGQRDHDVIHVGRREGAFHKLMIAVERSPIELHHMVVRFQDGSSYAPATHMMFGANTRSGVIDLPGSERVIRDVEFSYGNLPGAGHAEVELWGR